MFNKFINVVLIICFIGCCFFGYKLYRVENSTRLNLIETDLINIEEYNTINNNIISNTDFIGSVIETYNKKIDPFTKKCIVNEIITMSFKYRVLSPQFICAVITHESAKTWNPCVVSPVGARGLMQIMPATGKLFSSAIGVPNYDPDILFDPIININIGCYYLEMLYNKYSGDKELILCEYNAGDRNARRFAYKDYSRIPDETKLYIPSILKLYSKYKDI